MSEIPIPRIGNWRGFRIEMSKRVQLQPPSTATSTPEHTVPSSIECLKNKWICFPNGKRRRKATFEDSSQCAHKTSLRRDNKALEVIRVCGTRWQYHNRDLDRLDESFETHNSSCSLIEVTLLGIY